MSIKMVNVHKAFADKQVLKGFTLEIQDGTTPSVIACAARTRLRPSIGRPGLTGLSLPCTLSAQSFCAESLPNIHGLIPARRWEPWPHTHRKGFPH